MTATHHSGVRQEFVSIDDAMDAVVAGKVHPSAVREEFGDQDGFEALLNAAIAERERTHDEPVEDNIPADVPF